MKYLAILKDSFREAIDTNVFYVMVALSLVLIILVSSVGFTPRPATDLTPEIEQTLNTDLSTLLNAARQKEFKAPKSEFLATFKVAAVDAIDGPLDHPASSLRFLLRAHFSNVAEADRARKNPRETEEFIVRRFAAYGSARLLSVTDIQSAVPAPETVNDGHDPSEVYFQVTTAPTAYTRAIWPHDTTVLFGKFDVPVSQPLQGVGMQVFLIEEVLVNFLGASVTILVSVIITGFFIPNMLRKGTVDMLLVKPIRRWTLLIYKYLGGLTFIFLNTVFALGGVWLAFGLRTGLWSPSLFLMVFVITFYFAILYAVSTLVAVRTRSATVAILMSCLAWFIFWLVGAGYPTLDLYVKQGTIPDGWYMTAVKGIHYVLPRPKDLDRLAASVLQQDLAPQYAAVEREMNVAPVNWPESLTVSCVFIGVMLGLACLNFSMRDY
jgi:ABC-type transport system involved in multi-copper enzyme maturation permease subunit